MPSRLFALQDEDNRNLPVAFEAIEDGTVLSEIVSAQARTDKQMWRTDFPGTSLDTSDAWEVVTQGTGTTYSVAAGALTMGSGTTANSVLQIRSRRKFRIPTRTLVTATLSQRIANQTFYIELTNAAGTVFARWKFDGTTNTSGKVEVGTSSTTQVLDVAVSNGATSTNQVFEIDCAIDESNFRTRAVDSATAATERSTRTRNIPRPTDDLYLQFRIVNGGTAPATNTNFVVDTVLVQDVNELAVEIVGGRGAVGGQSAFPVTISGTPTITGTVSLANTFNTDSTTNLAAAATVTGASRDTNGRQGFASAIFADQPGTLFIDVSRDGTTWRTFDSATSVASTVLERKYTVGAYRYWRARWTNTGAATTTVLELLTAMISSGSGTN